jgi:sulfonate transport system permease protein
MNTENISVAQVKPGSFISGESAFAVPVRVAKVHRPRSRSREIPDRLLKLALPLFILAVWEAVTRLTWVDPVLLPTPLSVAQAFYELLFKDRLWLDFRVSAVTVLEGFVIGAGLGLVSACTYRAPAGGSLCSTFLKFLV